jgi:hypothetical protein
MLLEVPSFPLVVAPHVFDAWSWCKSDLIEWRTPRGSGDRRITRLTKSIEGANPPNLVFVMRDAALAKELALPAELAKLHAFGYGLENELALAPYAIDDATDLLYEHRARPHEVFWLAASTLDALVWGLHDWAHFHNHGPFDEPAMTELQCDLIAMAWLRLNVDRGHLVLDDSTVTKIADDLARLSRTRFLEENVKPPTSDLEALFVGPYPERPI